MSLNAAVCACVCAVAVAAAAIAVVSCCAYELAEFSERRHLSVFFFLVCVCLSSTCILRTSSMESEMAVLFFIIRRRYHSFLDVLINCYL